MTAPRHLSWVHMLMVHDMSCFSALPRYYASFNQVLHGLYTSCLNCGRGRLKGLEIEGKSEPLYLAMEFVMMKSTIEHGRAEVRWFAPV